jgi:hypothetical protein
MASNALNFGLYRHFGRCRGTRIWMTRKLNMSSAKFDEVVPNVSVTFCNEGGPKELVHVTVFFEMRESHFCELVRPYGKILLFPVQGVPDTTATSIYHPFEEGLCGLLLCFRIIDNKCSTCIHLNCCGCDSMPQSPLSQISSDEARAARQM